MIGFLRKPWWVGPLALVTGVTIGQHGATKSGAPLHIRGYEVVNSKGVLPRNGSVVVIAACPTGKRVIGGGYVAPSVADGMNLSILDGNSTWRVEFQSNGGSGDASVYAVCAKAKYAQRPATPSLMAAGH